MPWTEDAVPIPVGDEPPCQMNHCEREARMRLPGGQLLCTPHFQNFEWMLAQRIPDHPAQSDGTREDE